MLKIVYKSKNAVVIYKPAGIPTQPDPTGEPDAMTLTSALLKSEGERPDLWLVHRLDRVVGGLVAFARSKAAAAEMSEAVRARLVAKEYLAVVEGHLDSGTLTDLLYKDPRTSRAYVVDRRREGAREASLDYRALSHSQDGAMPITLLLITLNTGRFHQIRAQLSHRGNSILGDRRYGSRRRLDNGIALFALHLRIEMKDETVDLRFLPPLDAFPWSAFSEDKYRIGDSSND